LPKATSVSVAWGYCSALTQFNLDSLPVVLNASQAWRNTGLGSFSTILPSATSVSYAWYQCSSLSSFSTPVIKSETLGFAWLGCSALTDFAEGLFDNWNPSSITSGVFNGTWDGCTSLTAISVENILVSIDASNQHGTDDGTSTGNPLQDSGIDIDYDGTALSAATNTAVTSLKAKGWSIIVNNVTL
jgi:hypothetical protein